MSEALHRRIDEMSEQRKSLLKDYKELKLKLAAVMPYVQHKPACDLRGRNWPVDCTCGLSELQKDL
jgi:hypothetical protein